jgi:hypothetical protein
MLVLLLAGCGGGGLCMSGGSSGTASPMTFARGGNVSIAVTWPEGTWATAPTASGFAGELLAPGGSSLAGTLSGGMGTGGVVSFTVASTTAATLVLNVPTSSAPGTYTMTLTFRGSACGASGNTTLSFTVT